MRKTNGTKIPRVNEYQELKKKNEQQRGRKNNQTNSRRKMYLIYETEVVDLSFIVLEMKLLLMVSSE